MSLTEVDAVIADVKGKNHVQHHYRSNLCHIGLFEINTGHILLNYSPTEIYEDNIENVLQRCLRKNKIIEIQIIREIINKNNSYDLNLIVSELMKQNIHYERQNLIRWIRPIVILLKIVDCSVDIKDKQIYKKYLQDAYFKIANNFGDIVALEQIDDILIKNKPHQNVIEVLQMIFKLSDTKYKIELLMKPTWASKCKAYRLNEDLFTHIKLKKNL